MVRSPAVGLTGKEAVHGTPAGGLCSEKMNPYIGHESQCARIEEHRLVGGKGDGMRLFEMMNGRGLELTVSADRNADIARLTCRGINMSYFSPCGYVAPAYYREQGNGFLASFTAGFLTTCGLSAVGTPCSDAGEELPLHGTIANQPAEHICCTEEKDALIFSSRTSDEAIFGRKLVLHRTIRVSKEENSFTLTDVIENTGDRTEPLELLYHMNMGYPLLDEDSIVKIASTGVKPRNAHAAEQMQEWNRMEQPQAGYEERCYYHTMGTCGYASIFQPKLSSGLAISYDPAVLDCFVEWKMMGVRDYVLGLECGNCYPDGRDVMRAQGLLKMIAPGEKKTYSVTVRMMDRQEL